MTPPVADLLELADELESATEGSRELDAAIFHAIGAPVPFQFANKLIALEFNDVENAYFARVSDDMQVRYSPPAYTASLDAAMTLVPEGMTFCVDEGPAHWIVTGVAERKGRAQIYRLSPDYEPATGMNCERSEHGFAATPALALCAAALKALHTLRAAGTGES